MSRPSGSCWRCSSVKWLGDGSGTLPMAEDETTCRMLSFIVGGVILLVPSFGCAHFMGEVGTAPRTLAKMERLQHQVVTADGVQISFDLYREAGRDAAIVICPGFFQSKDTPTFQRLASALSSQCDVICMDFRGHGKSTGLFAFSAYEQADLNAVLDWVGKQYSRIGILGFSLGAATAINVASHRHGLRTLITVSAPSSFEEIEFKWWTPEAIKTGVHGLEPGAGFRPGNLWARKERPIDNIKRVAPVPILLIHGTSDQTVLYRHSERLYQEAREPKRLVLIQGGGHAEDLFRRDPEQFLPPIQEWLTTTLLE